MAIRTPYAPKSEQAQAATRARAMGQTLPQTNQQGPVCTLILKNAVVIR
jgi:hypothetical protein